MISLQIKKNVIVFSQVQKMCLSGIKWSILLLSELVTFEFDNH